MPKSMEHKGEADHRLWPIVIVVLGLLGIFLSNYFGWKFGWAPSEVGATEIAVLVFAVVFAVFFTGTDHERHAWWQKRQETLEKAKELNARLDALEKRLHRPSKR